VDSYQSPVQLLKKITEEQDVSQHGTYLTKKQEKDKMQKTKENILMFQDDDNLCYT